MVPIDKAGWEKDGISGGSILLLREGDEFDIVYTDVFRTVSSKEDGGVVMRMYEGNGTYALLIVYPKTSSETWVFRLNAEGSGELVLQQARYGDAVPIRKFSTMRAVCSK